MELLHQALFWIAIVLFCAIAVLSLEIAWGNHKVKLLGSLPPFAGNDAPKVSIIAAGRNEERNVEQAVRSLLAQVYPNYEVILVNDRSTDRTGEILDRLATANPQLRVVHITELPSGWLGKNHALQKGADAATGKILLFTDADIVMEPTSLSRAVQFMQETVIDHVAIGPNVNVNGAMLNIFVSGFMIFFSIFVKPWRVSNPKSKAHIGIGAFNLIRSDVYRRMGEHRAIAMRVDDDLKLGKLVKKNGFRQDVLVGRGMIFVEWYSSVGDAVRGLTKNMFAGVEFSVAVVIAATVAQLLAFVFPFVAIFFTSGVTQLLFGLAALLLWLIACGGAYHVGTKWYYGLGFPLATLMFLYILWRSTFLTLKNDGVNWRGTHYSLKDLKANKV